MSSTFYEFRKEKIIIPEANFCQVSRLSNAVNTTESDDVRLSRLFGGHDVAQNVNTAFRGEQSQQRVRQGVLDSAMNALEIQKQK